MTVYGPAIYVNGGTLTLNVGATVNGGLTAAAEQPLLTCLPTGAAFAKQDTDPTELIDGSVNTTAENLVVVAHPAHDFTDGTGKCPCGYVCDHGGKNGDDVYTSVSLDTGVCTVCQKQVYEAYQVGSDVIPWETLKDAVRHAYSTVYLYCDNDLNLNSFDWGGDVKLDLNGHQLATPFTVKTPRTLEIYDTSASGAGSLTVTSVEPQGALHIKGGTVKSVDQYNKMVSVYGTVYLSDGILTHVKVEDGGSLTASGGEIFALVRDAKENSRVDLEFESTYGTIEIWNATYDTALQALRDMVTPNFFFYTRIGHTLLSKADIKPLDGDVYAISDIIVDFHTSSDHIFGEDYTCICGYECEHGGKNAEGVYASVSLETGVCSICGKQTYEAYWQDGNVHPVETLEEALRGVDYPIHLYCDNDLNLNSVDWNGGHANLDLNGHNLTTPFAVQLAHTLEVQDTSTGDAGSLTLTSVESGGSLEINGGTVKSVDQYNQMVSVSGTVRLNRGTLTFARVESGGSLTASSGEMYALVKDVNEDSSVRLTGGRYNAIELWNATDDTALQAFRYMVVPDNCFFYIPIDRTNDRLLSKADIKHGYNSEKNAEIFTIGTVTVREHTVGDHVFDEDYTCICGYICDHGGENEDGLYANLDTETGKCRDCGKQLYIVKVTTENGIETFYDDIQKALDAAGNDFDPTVLLLLADSDSTDALDYTPYYGNGITLDLGSHTLRAPSVKVTCLDFTLKNGTLCSSGDSGIALELSHVRENVILEDVYVIGVVKASEWGCLTVNSGSFAGWQGKDYAFDLEEDAFSNQVKLKGGTFHGLQTKTASLLTFLPEGKAFARADGSLFDASVKETTETLTVVDHPSHTFVDGKCECGVAYVVKLIADGTEKDYTDLLTAYKATSNYSSATLRLLRDVHIGNTFLGLERASTDLTLDLNGHTLTGSNGNGVLYNIHADVTITITGEGSVKNTSADSGQIASIRVMEGTVIIQGGTYDPCVSRCDSGVLKIYGGVFKDSGGKYGAVVSFTNNGPVSGMKELLAEGKTFSYDPEGTELVNVYQGADGEYGTQGTVSTDPGRTVYVVDHPRHRMTVDLNTCPCGFYCNHREDGDEDGHFLVDLETGVCPRCDSQVFEAAATSGELYATLEQALDNASWDGLVIKLLCDVRLEHAYVVEENYPNFTLELNGHTVSAKGTVFSTRSTFTVKDSVGTGGIHSDNETAVYVQAGTLTVTGGSIHADRANAIRVEGDNTETPDSKLVVGGGTFTGLSNAVVINGGTIELAGGVIGTPDSGFYGLYIGSNSTESIFRDGVVHGICYESFGGVQRPLMESLAENTAFAFGAPYSEENLLNANKTWETHETVSIGHHENHVFGSSSTCACGRDASVGVTAGQSVTYYATLKEAVAYASQVENSVVKLWDNVSDSSIVINDGTFTIDFNALMWSASSTTPILIVTGDADITLTGYSGSGDGIRNKSTGAAIRNSGKLTIKGGTYYSAVVQTAQGSMQISGGVFKSGIAAGAAPALSCETGHLIDLLAEGYALSYDQAGTQLMDAYTSTATDSTKNVYVVSHTEHTPTEANGYTCPCGYTVVASVATDAEITYFASIDDAVNDAMSKDGSTLTLLRDVTLAEGEQIYVENGNFTIDWHSHTLHASHSSNALVVTYHASLTLTDTVGGGITNEYFNAEGTNLSGTAVCFNSDPGYTLTITGGTYSPTVKKMGYGTMRISGGVFQCPQGGSQNFALYNDKGDLSDILAPGYGFYNVNSNGSNSLAKFYGVNHSDENATVTVGEHKQHRLQDNGICVCDCGLRCWQKFLDENGHCDTCGYTFVAKVIVWTDYFSKTSSYFVEGKFNEAISHALNNPPAGTNDSSSVILLSDAVYSGEEAWNQNIDMDLNGHKLTLEKDAVVSGKVLILYGDQNSIIDGDGALSISKGLLTVKENSNPRIGYLKLDAGARATLAGGTYEDIINATGDAITLGSLLYTGYAFQSMDGAKNYSYNEEFQNLSDVRVVKCEHGWWSSGRCNYCNHKCEHPDVDDNDQCTVCERAMYASVTKDGVVTYYDDFCEACQAAGERDENAASITLTVLRAPNCTDTHLFSNDVTIDLNGENVTAPGSLTNALMPTGGATLTLKNSASDGTGECRKRIATDASNVGTIAVVSGTWSTVEVGAGSTFTMENGKVSTLKFSGLEGEVHGGTVKSLVSGAGMQLFGGTYLSLNTTTDVTLADILAPSHAMVFAGVKQRYSTLTGLQSYNDEFFSDLTVEECTDHVYVLDEGDVNTGFCVYCNAECAHKAPADMTDPKCPDCGIPIVASVTFEGNVTYYTSVSAALTQAASCTSEDGSAATLALLRDADLTETCKVNGNVPITLDLNGHSLTTQNDAKIILEDLGVNYPLVTFIDSHPGRNQSNVTVAVDHVRGWNARSASVVSGHWGTFNVKGHLTMSGGEVDVIDLDAKGAAIQPTAQISAGTVRWLGFDGKSKVTLTGGRYGKINAVQSTAFNYTTLLGDGNYAFAFIGLSGENRPSYANMTNGVGGVPDVEVVECGTDKYPHVYKDADGNPSEACLYCNILCSHTDETGTSTLDDDGVCSICGTRTALAKVIVNGESTLCKDIAEIHLAMGSAEDGSSITVKLLKDVDEPRNRFGFSRSTTVDLNGHNLNLGGFSISESDVTVTLVDTAENSTAKAEKLWLGGDSVTSSGSGYKIESGHWSIETFTGFHLWVTGGTFEELLIRNDEDAEGVRARISGGTVNNLAIEAADGITLEGGYFENVRLLDGGTETPFSKLLQADHAVAENAKGNLRVGYDKLPTITSQSKTVKYYVVECAVGQRNHFYKADDKNGRPTISTDTCRYCKHVCQHLTLDENGKCTECGVTMVASLTDGTTTRYFADVYAAFTKANALTEASGATITLLCDAQLTQTVQYTGSTPLTFDLNGTKLTPAAGVGIDVSQNGTTVTLTGKASYAEKSEVPIIITEGATLRVNRGIWGSINVENGTLEMMSTGEDGEHTLVDYITAITSTAKVRISGGYVRDKLVVSTDSDVVLTGGYFGLNGNDDNGIRAIPQGDFDFTTLLGTDAEAGKYYAFATKAGAKKFYSKLKQDTEGSVARIGVVECDHVNDSKGGTGFVDGVCQYCDYHCPHTDLDTDTGICGDCGMQFAATVTQGDTVEYYATLAEAVAAAHSATGSTVKLLTDNVLTEAITSTATMTLDLNGKRLTKRNTAGEFFVEGGTLTLVDSVGDGTAETIRFTFRNESRATLQSGKWGELHCFGLSRFSMEAGEAASIIANCDFFEVRGGKVGYLNVQNKYVTLVGGFFGRIASSLTLAEGEKPIPSFQLLGGRYVFQKGDGRVRYADLPDLPGGELTNVSVVECDPHDFEGTNYCIYCHLYCEHKALNPDTGYCDDCRNQIYEARIGDSYYPTLEAALAAAAAMGGNPTVTMLCNCGLDATYEVTGAYTLDLNGRELTSEGYTFPLHVKSGTLTIQDSKGTGKVSSEFGNGVETDKGAMLIVEGGTFGQHRSNGYNGLGLSLAAGSAKLRGGTIHSISSVSKLADIVDNGYWYYENDQLYKVGKSNGTNVTLTVKPHTHTYVDGECACGTLAQASVTATDGTVTYYTTFRQALDAAVANNGCTLTLLDSPKFGGDYEQTSGNFTLDLNGKELEDKYPFWTIRSPASVKFVGDGTVWPTLKLTRVGDETTGTAFYGGTYYSVLEVRGSTFVKSLGEANHFAFRNDADGTWLNPTSTNVWWYYNLTATAVPYVDVQPVDASVSYGADQLPAGLTNLTASFESDWTVSAIWYYKNADDQWVAITESKSLTSGTAYGAQQFDNTGFIVGQYTLRCDLTATKEGFPTYQVSSNEITLTVEKADPVVSAPTVSSGLVYTGEKQDLISTGGTTTGGKLLYSTSVNGPYSETIPTGTDAGTYEIWYKVEGDSNYKDSAPEKLGEVTISRASADKVEITLENDLVYDGTEQTQDVKITLNGKDVTDQFDITGNTRTDAGSQNLTVTAKADGSFSGSKQKEFTVAKKDIGDETATVVITLGDELTYNRSQQTKQVVEVKIGELVVPYYTVSGNVGTDAASYELTVTASSGNFTGSAKATWEIKPWDITNGALFMTVPGEQLVYNGEEQTNNAKVYLDGVDITAFCDIDGQTFKNAGSYILTATGKGNYTGKISTDYTVHKATVDVPALASKPYTGENQTADVPESSLYTVTKNNGGTAVGDYEVELTLTDPDNYQWKGSTGLDDSVTTSFSITHVQNGWDTEPTIDGWIYGDKPNAPKYEAKFGTVKVEYSTDADGSTYTTTVPTNAGSYKVRLTVDATGDFDALEKVLDVTIAKREVTITNTTVDTSKVYDGTTAARIAYAGIIKNMVANDDVKIAQGTAAYDNKNVGTAKTVTFTGFTLDGSAAANYILTGQPADTLADITAREITVTVTVKEKTFDGTTNAEIDSATLDNVVSGDDVKLTGGKPTLAGATPGEQNVTFEDFILEGEDAGNYSLTNPQPEGVTAAVTTNSSYLDLTGESDFDGQTDVSIDGDRYPIQEDGEKRYVTLPASCSLLTIYTYVSGDATPSHTNYPTSMRVYRILREDTGATVEHIPELDDLLIYNGCSIRVTGKQGIRMITGITKSNKAALTGSGLAGYTLMEYGTVVCWADNLPADENLTLSKGCARYNYAYKRGVADPVFARTGSTMQYTNVLVGFGLDECSKDLIMRPYIILRDANGETVTLYGGSVQRSIGYIATQNRTVFPAGTSAYKYVWNIIHAVYGDAYDSDYKG